MATSLASIELIKRSIISQGFRDHDMVSAELTAQPAVRGSFISSTPRRLWWLSGGFACVIF